MYYCLEESRVYHLVFLFFCFFLRGMYRNCLVKDFIISMDSVTNVLKSNENVIIYLMQYLVGLVRYYRYNIQILNQMNRKKEFYKFLIP